MMSDKNFGILDAFIYTFIGFYIGWHHVLSTLKISTVGLCEYQIKSWRKSHQNSIIV